jgi:hypothetical protein
MLVTKVGTVAGVDKFKVTLGGVLWNNCTTDSDCPGRALCSLNQTWSAYPSICHCSFVVQQDGAACETGKYEMERSRLVTSN